MWVSRAAATIVTVAIFIAACSSPSPPKVTFKVRATDVSHAAMLLRKKCPTDRGRVTIDIQPVAFRHTFTCQQMREPEASVEATLAASVATRHDAAHLIDRVIAFDKALGIPPAPRSEFVWYLGVTGWRYSCDHAADVPFRRTELSDAIEGGDNAAHWLEVEAPFIAGECPDRLATLYRTISSIGYAKAVADVRPVIAAIKVS